jgi:hypothetical protein
MMKTILAVSLALLAMATATPTFAQNAEKFVAGCQIDPSTFGIDDYPPVFTLNATKLCTGVASKRNIKLDCSAPLPGWPHGDLSLEGVECAINGDQCGVAPRTSDPNTPFLTATESHLKIKGGVATLTCWYKP